MPEPLSSKSGLGMKVTVLPAFQAMFLTTYLYFSTLSASLQQRVEAHVDLGLAGGADLVVVHLDLDADLLELQDHLGLRRSWNWSIGGQREVALLVARLVAEVRAARARRRSSRRPRPSR